MLTEKLSVAKLPTDLLDLDLIRGKLNNLNIQIQPNMLLNLLSLN